MVCPGLLYSNAGMYRSQCDPDGGAVYFGPRQQFRGYQTGQITDGVIKRWRVLRKTQMTPTPLGYTVARPSIAACALLSDKRFYRNGTGHN